MGIREWAQENQRKAAAARAELEAEWNRRGVLYEMRTQIDKGGATVTLYPDRLEVVRHKKAGALIFTGDRGSEMMPISSIASCEVKKKGALTWTFSAFGSGNSIQFDAGQGDALGLKTAVLSAQQVAREARAVPVVQAVESDPASQIRQLAGLRSDGLITEDEFEAKKKQLLGL